MNKNAKYFITSTKYFVALLYKHFFPNLQHEINRE